MKKLLLLLPVLLIAGIFFYACQDNPNVVEPKQIEKINIDASGLECTPIYAGQNTIVGNVCFDDNLTTNELTITYNVQNGWEMTEIHFAIGDEFKDIPMNKAGNLIPGQFPYTYNNSDGFTTYSITIPFSYFGASGCGDGKTYYAAAHCVVRLPNGSGGYTTETGWADGSIRPGKSWGEVLTFTIECENGGGGGTLRSETAFAYNQNGILGNDVFCFLDLKKIDATYNPSGNNQTNFNRWGWTNKISTGTYNFQIWAAAGQCNTANGVLVGTLHVVYDGSTATVTYNMYPGYTLVENSLYVGSERLPSNNGDYTIAPGQYPYKGATSYTITGLNGDVYVIAHATVNWYE